MCNICSQFLSTNDYVLWKNHSAIYKGQFCGQINMIATLDIDILDF